jgi:hypothetical protein
MEVAHDTGLALAERFSPIPKLMPSPPESKLPKRATP